MEALAGYELFRQAGAALGAALATRSFGREYNRLAVSHEPLRHPTVVPGRTRAILGGA